MVKYNTLFAFVDKMSALEEDGFDNMSSLEECNESLAEFTDYFFKDEDELISSWKQYESLSNFLEKEALRN